MARTDSRLENITRRDLRRCREHPDPELLLDAALYGNKALRRYLHRKVFGPLHGRAAIFDAIYVGITLSDTHSREHHLEATREALRADDQERLRAAASDAWWRLPKGYELLRPHIGSGKTSRVALVRRTDDESLLAWKIPANDSEAIRHELSTLVERSAAWHRLGVNSSVAEFAPDGLTVLQSYVDGSTLHRYLRNGTLAADPQARTELIELFRRIVDSRAFISGLNPRNLIHDGERWHVIDSGSVQRTWSVTEAYHLQRKDALHQWTRWTKDSGPEAEAVFDDLRASLRLPRFADARYRFLRLLRTASRRRRL